MPFLHSLFTPFPPNIFTCNKQWLNSVFLSSSLKLWVLVLNYQCPNKLVFFLPFNGFVCDNLKFSSVKSSKIFTAHRIQWNTKFKHKIARFVKEGFQFLQIEVFYCCEKTGWIDFPEEQAPTKVKHLLPVCQVSRNFIKGNKQKFTASIAFFAPAEVIKCQKTLTFSFEYV